MSPAGAHLVAAPILLPLATAALMLTFGEAQRRIKAWLNVLSCGLGLAVAAALAWRADGGVAADAIGVYLPANWEIPFGIVLAVDRLSAMMLVLVACLGLAAMLFSAARWDRAGVHFHALFQLQLMGLNGAFLTADLFNLFVFFEIMLAASYGLLLHGSGRARVRAGLHYIAVNLLASSFFLIGVSVLYGVTGTLNIADMARKLPLVPHDDIALLHAGAAILAVAFLAKAAVWPLNFWLAPAYTAAAAPVAALFAVMTKVGVYVVLRLWTLFFPAPAQGIPPFGAELLVWGGLATLAAGAIGVAASHRLGQLCAATVVTSSGTLLAAVGFAQAKLTAAALFYLLSSTLAVAALFLLDELIERARLAGVEPLHLDDGDEANRPFEEAAAAPQGANLDDDERAVIGQAIPAAMAFLGTSFIACALLVAGLPPLSGFVAKFGMLDALLDASRLPLPGWLLFALLIGSGFAAMIALSRAGIRYFWAPRERPAPKLRVIECLPVAALLASCVALTVFAGPVLRYARAAADSVLDPRDYVAAVMAARPVPNPPRSGGDAQ
ncbi:MAG TPA: monovalent cation/H+ antiporter subunit D [Burkholderiales bacterium]|nr:monovalent cation/H+ antiporter subunit D [Burkholderiales bacterium]